MPELSHRRRMLVLAIWVRGAGAGGGEQWARGTAERTAQRLESAEVREAAGCDGGRGTRSASTGV
ncbi:hypothetical protein [Streptomyces sp. NPDC050164]|uniref:hypothetical protein n=1 Tax=Streptomyces sp. NPDC050164 TaxID=3365605 RepID=UPI003788CC1A